MAFQPRARLRRVSALGSIIDTSVSLSPGPGILALSGPAPSLHTIVKPMHGQLLLTGPSPTVGSVQTVSPGVGQLSLAGPPPLIVNDIVLPVGVGQLQLTGPAPIIRQGATVQPGVGQLLLTGPAPTMHEVVSPGVGQLALTGPAPETVASGVTPSRTGTAAQINASGAGSGSAGITVPADCNLIVLMWNMFDGDSGNVLGTCSIDGDNFSHILSVGDGGDTAGHGVALLENPSTGAQTFSWAWSAGGARDYGGGIALVYITDANIGDPYRDVDGDRATATTNVSVTIDSETTDLILAGAGIVSGSPSIDGTVFINNWNVTGAVGPIITDYSQVTAGSPSTTIGMTGENYSDMIAISLKAS